MAEARNHAVACLNIQEADDGWVWDLIVEACGIRPKILKELQELGMAEYAERESTTRPRGIKTYWRLTPAYRALLNPRPNPLDGEKG